MSSVDLDRCLSLLKSARSDNERMAALLLVTKLVQSGEVGREGRRRVFDAMGFSFINRLLATRQVPEGCKENPYQKIAVTILACFCTDSELAVHPQVTSKIPLFNELILQSDDAAGSSLAEDALQCLQAMAATPLGLQRMWRSGTLEALAKGGTREGPGGTEARALLLNMLADGELVKEGRESLGSALGVLAREFRTNQDSLKFELCDSLYSILAVAGEVLQPVDPSWLQEVALGLRDILGSKIDASRRNSSLQLSALLCHLFGVEWCLSVETSGQRSASFFRLLISLVSVEVRLTLEGRGIAEVIADSTLLSSCFVILEQAVVYVANLSEQAEHSADAAASQLLTQEDLLQLHTTLTEAFSSVIYFLRGLEQLDPPNPTLLHHTVVAAAVRVLGAWLAEESLVLSADVYKLLPFLMKLCELSTSSQPAEESSFQPVPLSCSTVRTNDWGLADVASSKPNSLLKFLLPGLCHLTAEDRPRRILLEANFQKTLVNYFHTLCSQQCTSETQSQLCLCCGVLMNVCVCEPGIVGQGDAFSQLAVCLTKLTSKEFATDSSLLALNVGLLLLMVVRRQDMDRRTEVPLVSWCNILRLLLNVLQCCPHSVLAGASHNNSIGANWNEVSELWFLAMQELTVLAKSQMDLKQAATRNHILRDFREIVTTVAVQQEDTPSNEELQSIAAALVGLLKALDDDHHARETAIHMSTL